MNKAFTAYWAGEAWLGNSYRPVVHAASNEFKRRGVTPGDRIYIIHYLAREAYVGARLEVGDLVTKMEAAEALGLSDDEVWDASDHILAQDGTVQWLDPERVIPRGILRQLTFIRSDGTTMSPAIDADGAANQQTFRAVRELTPPAASKLDALLEPGDPGSTDIMAVTLRRGPCNGECPVYLVEYWRDGIATWRGSSFVERVGQYVGQVAPSEFRALVDFALEHDVFAWEPYGDPMFDAGDHEITIRTGAREKSVVRWYSGESQFEELGRRMEELAEQVDWQPSVQPEQ